jgi:biotin-dependent carboxylase-like uncharacterized protein
MLKVIKSGFYSTIQDTGRFGFRACGVPISGAMDMYSSRFANSLLGNDSNAALIEMTMVGGVFQFTIPTVIAISGANMDPQLNGHSIITNSAISINANDILSFGKVTSGFRTYIAIKGGFNITPILDSRSQYKSVTSASTIYKDDLLSYKIYDNKIKKRNALVKYNSAFIECNLIEAYKGPEYRFLSKVQKEVLFKTKFKVSKYNNRMAYQLEPYLKNDLKPILTAPVLPGTVQLTPMGHLIVLMRDCQTTGGYPRILQLTDNAINVLSQKTIGNDIKIRLRD